MNKNIFFAMLLTWLRIFLTPVFVILLFCSSSLCLKWAIIVFTIAACTDFLDGKFARRFGGHSEFGKFFDPFADKILVLSAFFSFYFLNLIPLWVPIIIALRDILITVFRVVAVKNGNSLATSVVAKYKTTFQFFAIYSVFAYLFFKFFPFKCFADFLIYFTVLFTIWTGVNYFWENRRLLKRIFI